MIKAVVFDLDDTLAPEYGYVLSGYEALAPYLAERTGHTPGEVFDSLCALFAEDSRNVFNRLLEGWGIIADRDEILKLVRMYREHEPGSRYGLYEDVRPSYHALKKAGLRLGILTDGFATAQRNKMKALGIAQADSDQSGDGDMESNLLFDYIEVTAELGDEYRKPGEAGFLLMAQKLGVDCSEMAYVGDNPEKDFYIKKYLPVVTMRIRRERGVYLDSEYREGLREDYELKGLGDILRHTDI